MKNGKGENNVDQQACRWSQHHRNCTGEHPRPVSSLLKGLIRRKNNEKTKLSNAATENRTCKPTLYWSTLFSPFSFESPMAPPPGVTVSLVPLWFPWWYYVVIMKKHRVIFKISATLLHQPNLTLTTARNMHAFYSYSYRRTLFSSATQQPTNWILYTRLYYIHYYSARKLF